uniref:FSH1 domain-containing protein n=1 Tax=Parastrongyloides trichosuri TaxID=131310 RepID=A0A0N4Z4E4_PARTI
MVELKKKLKILCLHGYRQNALMFREKTGGLRKALKSLAEFEFITAPLIPDIPVDSSNDCDSNGTESSNEIGPRAWWFSKEVKTFSSKDVCNIAVGFDEAVKEVTTFIKENGPFDGLMGFSQGASMVHLLTSLGYKKEIQLSWKFIIMMSSFKSLSSVHESLIDNDITGIPSLQIYGENDQVVNCERSKELTKHFSNPDPIIITHPGGHCVPPMSSAKEPLRNFLKQFL